MDSVDVLGDALAGALVEYHDDLKRIDDERERAVIDAFVERVRRNVAAGVSDEAASEKLMGGPDRARDE